MRPDRRKTSVIAVTLSTLAYAAGCGVDAERTEGPAVRDSAGITIVQNTSPVWSDGAAWRVATKPIVTIGGLAEEEEDQLFRVVDAVRLSDGRIVVANAGTQDLRFYDAEGRFLQASGGEGSGPGEFQALAALIRLPADSLLTWDFRNRRAQVFGPDGGFARSFQIESQVRIWPLGAFGDGTLLVSSQDIFGSRSRPDIWRDSLTYLRYDRTGEPIDTVGEFAGPEYYTSAEGAAMASVLVTSRILGLQPQTAVHGTGFYYGESDEYEIGYYAANGELQRLIRLARPSREVSADLKEQYVADLLERSSNEQFRTRLERIVEEMPFPETLPAFQRMLVDPEGNLWVADYPPPGGARTHWSVFDPDGRWLGALDTPNGLTVYQIGTDFILGRRLDELNVERLDLYRLERT